MRNVCLPSIRGSTLSPKPLTHYALRITHLLLPFRDVQIYARQDVLAVGGVGGALQVAAVCLATGPAYLVGPARVVFLAVGPIYVLGQLFHAREAVGRVPPVGLQEIEVSRLGAVVEAGDSPAPQ